MVGLCDVDEKLFGPVQFQLIASVAPPVNVKVLPTQIGFGLADAVTADGTVQPMQPKATQVEVGAFHASKHWVVVLKISNELAGDTMASRCAVVKRGISKPDEPLTISSIADESGVAPVVLMPTFWANPLNPIKENKTKNLKNFFILINF